MCFTARCFLLRLLRLRGSGGIRTSRRRFFFFRSVPLPPPLSLSVSLDLCLFAALLRACFFIIFIFLLFVAIRLSSVLLVSHSNKSQRESLTLFFFSKIPGVKPYHIVFFRYEKRRRGRPEEVMSSSGGATTRAKKRRTGQRDLWDVIVNNDDVCFEHILPRLNQTDLKFLHEVNGETRALIKRSSREDELENGFKVEEMSSISTLEVAWENRSLWPDDWDKEWADKEDFFCSRVARTNKLELLKWIREEKKCHWNELTINAAARQGNLEMVKYCVANQCPFDEGACRSAAANGHLDCLKYLHEDVKAPWDCETAYWAARNGHLHILEYLVEREYDEFDEYACAYAAWKGHLECLKYLHEDVKAPWGEATVRSAHEYNHSECLQYLLDNDCPLPQGWSYEHGILNKPRL